MKKNFKALLLSFSILFALSLGGAAFAQGILGTQPTGGGTAPGLGGKPVAFTDCVQDGSCGVEHILILANNVIRWLAGASGAIALLMYIIGGVWMIFSGGSSSRVERGKDILIGTTIALVFILGSWVLINFTLQALGTQEPYQLTPATCGGATCTAQQTCINNSCHNLCDVTASQDTANPWACQDISNCGVFTYDDCVAGTQSNCKAKQCSGPNNIVCCYPK